MTLTLDELIETLTKLRTEFYIKGNSPVVTEDGGKVCGIKVLSDPMNNKTIQIKTHQPKK